MSINLEIRHQNHLSAELNRSLRHVKAILSQPGTQTLKCIVHDTVTDKAQVLKALANLLKGTKASIDLRINAPLDVIKAFILDLDDGVQSLVVGDLKNADKAISKQNIQIYFNHFFENLTPQELVRYLKIPCIRERLWENDYWLLNCVLAEGPIGNMDMQQAAATALIMQPQLTDEQFSAVMLILFQQFQRYMGSITPSKHKRIAPELYKTQKVEPKSVIYNHDGYPMVPQTYSAHIKGTPCKLNQSAIGYNIHLPHGEVKCVLVDVYGGGGNPHVPNGYHELCMQWLKAGIAIVTLNLPDLNQLPSIHAQLSMTEALHDEIHQCIHHFYHQLRHHPQSLHPMLDVLKDKKLFLYGMSFGGRTALMHAQRYPDTFSGYISQNGANVENDGMYRWQQPDHLNPGDPSRMGKIRQPVLLVHNADDNNVSVHCATEFYQRMATLGKKDLIRIMIIDRSYNSCKAITHKGHGIPLHSDDFERVAWTMQNFMLNGPSALSTLDDWRAHKYRVRNEFSSNIDFEDIFIDKAMRIPRTLPFAQMWDQHYMALYHSLCQAKYLANSCASSSQALINSMYHAKIRELSKSLTDDQISKYYLFNRVLFQQYLHDFYKIQCPYIDSFMEDADWILTFREQLQQLPATTAEFSFALLITLFQANPDLKVLPMIQADNLLERIKSRLQLACIQHHERVASVWRQAAKLIHPKLTFQFDQKMKRQVAEPNAMDATLQKMKLN